MGNTTDQSGLGDLAADYGEIVLDKFLLAHTDAIEGVLDSETLRDIPGIKTVLSVGRAIRSLPEYYLKKKVERFLQAREEFSDKEREDFARKMNENPKYRERVIDAVLLRLEKLDDIAKAELFARAFSAFVRDEINFYNLERYLDSIKLAHVTHLQNLYLALQDENGDSSVILNSVSDQVLPLSALGLVEISEDVARVVKPAERGEKTRFIFTFFGRNFIRTVIRKDDIKADD